MPPQLFAKFQYKDRIKKIGFSEEDFTWENVCKVLLQSFNLPAHSVKLSYKDSDGDEITVCCNEDLAEAFKSSLPSKQLRFFVYKCNPPLNKARTLSDDTISQLDQTSTSYRERSLTASFAENNKELLNDLKLERIPSIIKEEKHSHDEPQIEKEEQKEEKIVNYDIKLDAKELGDILCRLLATDEGKKSLNELKNKYKTENKLEDAKNSRFTVSIDDKQVMAEKIKGAFNNVINEKFEEKSEIQPESNKKENKNMIDLNKSIDSEVATEEEVKSIESKSLLKNDKSPVKTLYKGSFNESLYEDSRFNTLRDRKAASDFKSRSLSQTYNNNYCKDLSTSFGVKLALKCVDGKMKMVSVPINDYCIIEAEDEGNKEKKEVDAKPQKSASVVKA